MKTYIVYVNGHEQPEMIKAASHNAAEAKAKKKYPDPYASQRKDPFVRCPGHDVSVTYTEV